MRFYRFEEKLGDFFYATRWLWRGLGVAYVLAAAARWLGWW